MKLNEFIKAMPDCLPVVIGYDWDTFRMTMKDLKEYPEENKHMVIESYHFEKDLLSWYVANDIKPDPLPDPIGEYMFIYIYDESLE